LNGKLVPTYYPRTLPAFSNSHKIDISYLKTPPLGYLSPPVAILSFFNTILSNIEKGVYANERGFQTDLLMLFPSVQDGHFHSVPVLLS
jgi:hypothetical protein